MITKIRHCLERNEIFFKIFAAVFLSGMAIYVSWQANAIADKQTQIFRQEQMPAIRIMVDFVYNPSLEKYTEDKLVIYNDGAPLYNLNIERVTFLEIVYGIINEPLQSALINVYDYYVGTIHTGNATGELAIVLNNEGNNLRYIEIEQSFATFARKNNAFGFTCIRRYVGLTYRDVFGEYHSEIYYVDPINGSNKLSNVLTVEQIPNLYKNAYPIDVVVFLYEITPELMIKWWEDLISH